MFWGYVDPRIIVLPLLFCKSSVCWNPFLYVAKNFQVSTYVYFYKMTDDDRLLDYHSHNLKDTVKIPFLSRQYLLAGNTSYPQGAPVGLKKWWGYACAVWLLSHTSFERPDCTSLRLSKCSVCWRKEDLFMKYEIFWDQASTWWW